VHRRLRLEDRASGSALVYSTYLYGEVDGRGQTRSRSTASGNALRHGHHDSGLFPILQAFQHVDRGLADAFVAS